MTARLMTFRANREQKQARLVSAEVQPKSNLLKKLLLSISFHFFIIITPYIYGW